MMMEDFNIEWRLDQIIRDSKAILLWAEQIKEILKDSEFNKNNEEVKT